MGSASQDLPRVTVVVPAFNAGAWIAQTLQSVFDQTYPRELLDVVLVDDGSSDGTGEKAAALLRAAGIEHAVLAHESTRGPSASRNRGWRHGRGDWVQFLDADDLIAPNKIATQMSAAFGAADGVAAVFSAWTRLTRRGDDWSASETAIDPAIGADPVLDLLRPDNFIATGSQLFRRSWLDRVGGYVESYRFIEDVDLLLRIVFADGQLVHVPSAAPLFFYRQHDASLAHSDGRAFMEGCLRNARLAEDRWRERDQLTQPRAQIIAHVLFLAARFYAERDPARFHTLTSDIYRLNPRFLPDEPASLRVLSRIIGYASAEQVAVRYRRLRRTVFGSTVSGGWSGARA